MSDLPFDPNDPAVRRWLVDLNVTLDDADAVVRDMLRAPQQRELGPVKHRELYREAWEKLMSLLGRALPPEEPESGPPTH